MFSLSSQTRCWGTVQDSSNTTNVLYSVLLQGDPEATSADI